jgi:DNA replication licensing factor MCM6
MVENSKFVDWQKVRVQENSDEIPSGSMPRSLDIILRHEEVEKAKAGDKVIFIGSLIVVPDIGRSSTLPGPKSKGVMKSSQRPRNENAANNSSNTPINSTKDYSYKLCFLASSVQPAELKVFIYFII